LIRANPESITCEMPSIVIDVSATFVETMIFFASTATPPHPARAAKAASEVETAPAPPMRIDTRQQFQRSPISYAPGMKIRMSPPPLPQSHPAPPPRQFPHRHTRRATEAQFPHTCFFAGRLSRYRISTGKARPCASSVGADRYSATNFVSNVAEHHNQPQIRRPRSCNRLTSANDKSLAKFRS